jgi:hypothetical protein
VSDQHLKNKAKISDALDAFDSLIKVVFLTDLTLTLLKETLCLQEKQFCILFELFLGFQQKKKKGKYKIKNYCVLFTIFL